MYWSHLSRRFGCFLVVGCATSTAWANSAVDRGLEIAREADSRDRGWADSEAELEMILRNLNGDESRRDLRIQSLEEHGDGDKSLVIFDHPPDVKGTALLTDSHINEPDDQWLYLPALKRVKRISSSNKSGPFMGSEFAYEDLSSQEVDEYTYKYIGEETLDGQPCYMVERVPLDQRSGYTRQLVWYDQAEYRVQKIEFYDRKNALLKTLTMEDYRQYKGSFWRAHIMHMANHQTGKSTILDWKEFSFGNGYSERDFSRTALQRAR